MSPRPSSHGDHLNLTRFCSSVCSVRASPGRDSAVTVYANRARAVVRARAASGVDNQVE